MGVLTSLFVLGVLLVGVPGVVRGQDYTDGDYWGFYDDYFFGGVSVGAGGSDREPWGSDQNAVDQILPGDGAANTSPCNTTADCVEIDAGGICVWIDFFHNGTFCVCDDALGLYNINDNCTHIGVMGEICMDVLTVCSDENAICREDGTNVGQRRCLCDDGFVGVVNETALGGFTCHTRIHDRLDPACTPCEDNGGMCYDSNNDDLRDGCVCPISFSGDNCGFQNVNVTCDIATFEMVVCYWPHSDMNFTDGVFIHVDGLLGDPACWGIEAEENDTYCPENSYKLVLPLDEEERTRCNTDLHYPDIKTMQFENKIVVHGDRVSLTENDVIFRTYCSFSRFADNAFQPLGIISINRNDRGEHKRPGLTMAVENLLGNRIPDGVPIRLGDKIKFRMTLDNDGTYSAIRILRCTASNKATIPDPKAVTVPLVINSCPYARQKMITYKNAWRRVQNRAYDLQTGAVKMFKMAQGDSVHIHCAAKLCLAGSEEDCSPIQCKNPHKFAGYGRKRRAVDDEEFDSMNMVADSGSIDVLVSREITFEKEVPAIDRKNTIDASTTKSTNKPMFMVVILGMVGLVLVVMVAMGVFVINRVSRRQSTTGGSPSSTRQLNSSLDTSFSPNKQPSKISTVENLRCHASDSAFSSDDSGVGKI